MTSPPIFKEKTVLVLYLKESQKGEFAFADEMEDFAVLGSTEIQVTENAGKKVYSYIQTAGSTVIQFSSDIIVYLLEQTTAWRFWAPATTQDPNVQPHEQVFVLGPYLVRSAVVKGDTVYVVGDNDIITSIEVFAGKEVHRIAWNRKVQRTKSTFYGSLTASVGGGEMIASRLQLPDLTALDWSSAEGLPERNPTYDDSRWAVCSKTSTFSPISPLTLPNLFSSDYGFYQEAKIYRGRFMTTSNTSYTGANVTASGGLAFGWSAWLNGAYVGGDAGNGDNDTTSASLAFGDKVVNGENILTVVVDYTGHDQTSTAYGVENPRGLLGERLIPGRTDTMTGFDEWRLVGAAGQGYDSNTGRKILDPVRGPMNESGLYGERLGWYLPGFKYKGSHSWQLEERSNYTPKWIEPSSPMTDGVVGHAIRFFATTLDLKIPSNADVPLGFVLSI